MKGSRIHSIVRELENENIDVINYTTNTELFIARALSPAKISSIKIDHDHLRVAVYLKPDQVSLAIGKGGQNIRLAGKLVGMEIDVFREPDGFEDEDDIDLQEFDDEIEVWQIEELRRIGLDTARAVLRMSKSDLVRRTELEEEMVQDIFDILKKEFEEEIPVVSDDVAEDEEASAEAESTGEEAETEAETTPKEEVAEASPTEEVADEEASPKAGDATDVAQS
jgi:N utilization substance protein A